MHLYDNTLFPKKQYLNKNKTISFFVISNIDKNFVLCYNTYMKNFYKSNHFAIFDHSFCDWNTGELLSPLQTQNYTVLQVAELYYNNAFYIKSHLQHCDLEITFPTTNGLSCTTDGKEEKLRKHETYLSFKGDKHEASSRSGCRFQTFAVNFKTPESQALFSALQQSFRINRKRYSPDLAHFFTSIISEFLSANQTFFLQNLDSLITMILVRIARANQSPLISLPIMTYPLDILHYIDEHFLDICSLDELSNQFGYTYGHICKMFKKEYMTTPVEYLLTKKMEYVVLLLSQGKTLSEIAEVTGYSTPYNLSRAFKKYFGTTPNELKKHKHPTSNNLMDFIPPKKV